MSARDPWATWAQPVACPDCGTAPELVDEDRPAAGLHCPACRAPRTLDLRGAPRRLRNFPAHIPGYPTPRDPVTGRVAPRCAAPDCGLALAYAGTGKPPKYCDAHARSRKDVERRRQKLAKRGIAA